MIRRASRDMVGEFALMVCTTLEPRMGVFSLPQAFSIGHNLTTGDIFGSVGPLGVTTCLQQGSAAVEADQIYLEDGQYATLEFAGSSSTESIRVFNLAEAGDSLMRPAIPSPRTLLRGKSALSGGSGTGWFPVNNNPKIIRSEIAPLMATLPQRICARFRLS